MKFCSKCQKPYSQQLAQCPQCQPADDADDQAMEVDKQEDVAMLQVRPASPDLEPDDIEIKGIGRIEPPQGSAKPYNIEIFADSVGGGSKAKLVDSRGRQWRLFLSRNQVYFWRKFKKPKGKGNSNFSMHMRVDHGAMTMQGIADNANNKLRALDLAGYSAVPMATAMNETGRNSDKRESQGGVMFKFFKQIADTGKNTNAPPLNAITPDHARVAISRSQNNYLGASGYVNDSNYEWLHLQGHGLGGTEVASNLVAGSHGANTEMAAIEMVLQQFSDSKPGLRFMTVADCYPGTLWAIAIRMEVELDGTPIFARNIDANRKVLFESEFNHIQEELINRILTKGLKGREIKFVQASDPVY